MAKSATFGFFRQTGLPILAKNVIHMEKQDTINYHRIERAIAYIITHFRDQPTLNEIAAHVHLSPAHFQRLFVEWAGTSPKKFLKYISLAHAKELLSSSPSPTLFDTSHEVGLSSTSRLHDLFVTIEGMTPATYKQGGKGLRIAYAFYDSPFGGLLVASTQTGICHAAFWADRLRAEAELREQFPHAEYVYQEAAFHRAFMDLFAPGPQPLSHIKLHLKGTEFQLKVWEALLTIPMGALGTYASIAEQIGKPAAHRAVGTAIGRNPVAFLIPCHRVIQRSGLFGGYRWGAPRKAALIGWEQSQVQDQLERSQQ